MFTRMCLSFVQLFEGMAHAEHVITLNNGAAGEHTHARLQSPGEELGCKHTVTTAVETVIQICVVLLHRHKQTSFIP